MKVYIAIIRALFFITCSTPYSLVGQEVKQTKWAAQFNLQHQDIAALSEISIGQLGVIHKVFIRPYYSLDIQRFFFRKTGKNKFFLLTQFGYFANLYQDRWLSLEFGMGYERRFAKRFFSSLRVKIGNASVKDHDILYVYEQDKWVETPNPSESNPSSLTTVRIDLGYKLLDKKLPVDLVGSGQYMLRNHHDFGFIPYSAVGLGIRVGF